MIDFSSTHDPSGKHFTVCWKKSTQLGRIYHDGLLFKGSGIGLSDNDLIDIALEVRRIRSNNEEVRG